MPSSPIHHPKQQNNKKEFIEESKARNNSFHRKAGGKNNASSVASKSKASSNSSRTNLPKLKSLIPSSENKSIPENSSFKKHTKKQPKKYNKVRSSGYGSSSLPALPSTKSTSGLPSLNENHGYRMPRRRVRGLR